MILCGDEDEKAFEEKVRKVAKATEPPSERGSLRKQRR